MRELLLALVVVSGPLKSHLKLLGIGLPDITILASALAAILLLIDLGRQRFVIKVERNLLVYLFAVLAFVIWSGVTAFWSSNNRFWLTKFALFFLPIFVSLFPALSRSFDRQRFFSYLFLISGVIFLMFIYYFPRWRLGLLDDSGLDIESYKTIYLGVGILASLNLLIVLLIPHKNLLIKVLKAGFLLNVIFLASARAATLFVVLMCCLWAMLLYYVFLYHLRIKQKNVLYSVLVFIGLGFITYQLVIYWEIVAELANHSITRFATLFQDNKGASISSRTEHLHLAFQAISNHPWFGIGLSSYSDLRIGQEVLDHPHNMFVEVWLEQGTVGLLLLIAMIFVPVYTALHKRDFLLLSCILFLLSVSLTAFSYVENRVLFSFLGMAFVLQQIGQAGKAQLEDTNVKS